MDGKWTQEKTVSIISHQESGNKNHNKMPQHIQKYIFWEHNNFVVNNLLRRSKYVNNTRYLSGDKNGRN